VYVTLDQLDDDGMVTGRSDDHGERERVVYRITRKGQAALRSWLTEPPRPLKVRDELLLKVMLGGTRHVQQHKQEMLDRHKAISKAQAALPEMDVDTATRRQLGLTLDLGRRVTAAHLAWCDDTLKAPKGRRR
jgi:DNA-binding MarR family transcriptional regulator